MLKIQRDRYPADWDVITDEVRAAASWRCEECGRDCQRLGETLHDFALRLVGTEQPLRLAPDLSTYQLALMEVLLYPGCWRLQTAHINQRPEDCDRRNLRAMCAPCHRGFDNLRSHRLVREQIKAERAGLYQLPLF